MVNGPVWAGNREEYDSRNEHNPVKAEPGSPQAIRRLAKGKDRETPLNDSSPPADKKITKSAATTALAEQDKATFVSDSDTTLSQAALVVPSTKPTNVNRWRAEISRKSSPVTAGENNLAANTPAASPQTPTRAATQKRKRESDVTPQESVKKKQRVKHGSTKVLDITDNPVSSPASSSKPSKQHSPELGTPSAINDDAENSEDQKKVKTVSPSDSPARSTKRVSYNSLSTQALYAGEVDQKSFAEEMDFGIPGFSSDSDSPSSPPPPQTSNPRKPVSSSPKQKSNPSDSDDDPDGVEEMNRYLSYCQSKYSLSSLQVIFAVERTGGIKEMMEIVLQALSEGRELPTGEKGIWTEEEDKILMGADSREMKRLAERKGTDEVERRMDFLNLWNMA
jgi:TRF2-interacting telomeric protein/Rap1 - C terminal domain